MVAELIDGKAMAARLRADLRGQLEGWQRAQRPGLAVVLVGTDPASAVYVRNKIAACEEVGLYSRRELLPADATQERVMAVIDQLNADATIHGILVQLPLPPGLDANRVLARIDPAKDVDGFGGENQGALVAGLPGLRPCTPMGVMAMLQLANVSLRGAHAAVAGRSNIVGKPLALLLLQANATVTVCHSLTRDLASVTRSCDVLVAAVGRPRMITADMVKPGATVIDVGINRGEDGKLCGDVDFHSVCQVAAKLSPVPGGVGPMTIAMLLQNTLLAFKQQEEVAPL